MRVTAYCGIFVAQADVNFVPYSNFVTRSQQPPLPGLALYVVDSLRRGQTLL